MWCARCFVNRMYIPSIFLLISLVFIRVDANDENKALRAEVSELKHKVQLLTQKLVETSLSSSTTSLPFGVYPMLRDMGCTHKNLQVPHLIDSTHGQGRVIIDIGLGYDAQESISAIKQGLLFLPH